MATISQTFSSVTTSIRRNNLPFNPLSAQKASCRPTLAAACCERSGSTEVRSPPDLPAAQLLTPSQPLPGVALAAGIAAASLVLVDPVAAIEFHAEPTNALSLPTWAVHTSSVLEWLAGMSLMWKYGEVSGNPRWKGMTWGMLPCLGSAMCACTWHFFYNSSELEFLVSLQAALTVLGNFTLWLAAYKIFEGAQTEKA